MAFKLMYWSVTLLFVLSLGLCLERRAFAYTDPGSCLLLFQSMGAVASGALFYFRRSLKRIFVRPELQSEAKKPLNAQAIVSRADS